MVVLEPELELDGRVSVIVTVVEGPSGVGGTSTGCGAALVGHGANSVAVGETDVIWYTICTGT